MNSKNDITNLFYKRSASKKVTSQAFDVEDSGVREPQWNDPENAEVRRLQMRLQLLKELRQKGERDPNSIEVPMVELDQSIMEIERRLAETGIGGM